MVTQVDWNGAWTFDDYVISLFKDKKTKTDEFDLLLRVYGREKLEKLWNAYKEENKSDT